MRYDFDMFSLIPDDAQSQFQEMFNDLGLNQMTSEQKALWRDPKVVEALQGADPIIKDMFIDAGFGINCYDSGAPTGRYFSRDKMARQKCEDALLDTLSERLSDGSLDGANWNGFGLKSFLEYLDTVEPIDEIEAEELQLAAQQASKEKAQKRLIAFGVMAIGVLAVGFVAVSMLTGTATIASL